MQDIGEKHNNLSEVVFNVLLFMFVMWSLSPFVLAKKRFYTVVLYTRTLIVLVVSSAPPPTRLTSLIVLISTSRPCSLDCTWAWPSHPPTSVSIFSIADVSGAAGDVLLYDSSSWPRPPLPGRPGQSPPHPPPKLHTRHNWQASNWGLPTPVLHVPR
jgi:hypothetical protein